MIAKHETIIDLCKQRDQLRAAERTKENQRALFRLNMHIGQLLMKHSKGGRVNATLSSALQKANVSF